MIWPAFHPPPTGGTVTSRSTLTFDTSGSAITDSMIYVHSGSGCSALCIEGNDNTLGPGLHASVTVAGLDVGEEVLIQLGSASPSDVGTGMLTISSSTPCPGTWALSVPCDTLTPHHLGGSGSLIDGIVACPLSSSGTTFGTGVGSGLRLQATGGPPGSFGFFLVAPGAGGSFDILEGVLRLEAPQGRYNASVAANQGLPQLKIQSLKI